MTITIRTITEADIDAADAIQAAAYGTGGRAALMRLYLKLQPDGWIIASADGVPAGFAGIVSYGLVAYVGLVSVLPAMQRRGIGQAMMVHLLEWARAHGGPAIVLDASAAGAPIYERLGFVDDEKTLVFVRDDCSALPDLSDRVVPFERDDIAAVAAFDAPIFGAARTAVFRHLLADLPGRAFVAREPGGQVAGYLFAQPKTIGPWAARTAADAERLLGAALRLGFEEGPRVLVPGSNVGAPRLLMRYGFSPQRTLRHMRLGGDGPFGQRAALYGLASFAIG
jgi:GNAT superfamily N-acetyltransferase